MEHPDDYVATLSYPGYLQGESVAVSWAQANRDLPWKSGESSPKLLTPLPACPAATVFCSNPCALCVCGSAVVPRCDARESSPKGTPAAPGQ